MNETSEDVSTANAYISTYVRPVFRYEAIRPNGAKTATVVRVRGPNPELLLETIADSRLEADCARTHTPTQAPAPVKQAAPPTPKPTRTEIELARAALRRGGKARQQEWDAAVAAMPSGAKLAAWREEADMSQRDVAKQLGVTRGIYAMVEREQRKSPELRVRAATLFGKKQGVDW